MKRLGSLLLASISISCGSGFEPPCRVTDVRIVLDEPAPLGPVIPPAENADGSVAYHWWSFASDPGSPFLRWMPEIAAFDPSGALLRRHSISTSTEAVASAFVATSTSIALLSVRTTTVSGGYRSVLWLEAQPFAGAVTASTALAECFDCFLLWTAASFEDRVVIAHGAIGTSAEDLPRALELDAIALSADGTILSRGALASIPLDPSMIGGIFSPLFSLIPDRRSLLLRTATQVYRVDASGRPIAGPIDLPLGDADVAWSEDRLTFAWTEFALGLALFTQTFRADGEPAGEPNRLSTATSVLDTSAFGDGWAVAFVDRSETFLAIVDGEGRKLGGDLPLGISGAESRVLFLDLLVQPSAESIAYFHWTEAGIERVEVTCAP